MPSSSRIVESGSQAIDTVDAANGASDWRLSAEQTTALDTWFDQQLEALEARFHDFCTPSSLKANLGR